MFLAIILIIASILRLISLNQSLWLDEAVQIWASRDFSLADLLTKYLPQDFNPPAYHLLLHFWIKIFGSAEAGVRLLSVFLALGSICLIWQIGKKLKMAKAGQLAALFLATSPLHIYYSQEARMYMLACFSVLLATWCLLQFLASPTWQNSLFFGLSLVLMSFSHFLTLLFLPIFLFRARKEKKIWLALFIWLLSFLVYSPLFFQQLTTGLKIKALFPVWGRTVGGRSFKAIALLPVKFIIGRINLANRWLYGLGAGGLVLLYWGIIFWRFFALPSLLLWLIFFPLVAGFLLSFWLPVFSYFRFLPVLPFFYLGVAAGLTGKKKPLRRLVILLVGINLCCAAAYLFNPKFHRENWQDMVAWLQRKNKNYQAPVLILGMVAKPFEYYDQGESRVILLDPQKMENFPVLASQTQPVVYLVSYALPIFDPQDRIRETLKGLGYQLRSGESFRGVGIELWRQQ